MNKIYILLLLSLVALTSRAESNKGLTDTDNYVEKRTTTLFDDFWYKTRQYGLCAEPDDPYAAFNTMIVGTWYENQSNKITFNADGTTDYGTGYTYKFIPLQGTILMYNSEGTLANQIYVMKMSGDTMILRESGSNEMKVYTNFFPPVKHVTKILNVPDEAEVSFSRDGSIAYSKDFKITPVIIPQNADNRELIWTSTDEKIAKVYKGANGSYEISPGLTYGTAYLTCTAADGSGVSVTCKVVSTHEYVDLGLSVNWATMNVGATERKSAGYYFAWGETEPASESKQIFSWETYKWAEGTENDDPKMTKYCDRAKWGIVDNKMVLDLEDDAAHVYWGEDWRMPTVEEVNELIENCTFTNQRQYTFGEEWITATSKINGNKIFIPFSVFYGFTGLADELTTFKYTYFWTSSYAPRESMRPSANCFYYLYTWNLSGQGNMEKPVATWNGVCIGYPIRPVRPNPNYKK